MYQKLHKQTVSHSLLSILEDLMKIPDLDDYLLVGGTSLALRYGHRDSEDIDLFTSKTISSELWKVLSEKPNSELLYRGSYTLTFQEDGIKVDLAKWNIDFIQPDTIENIRLANPLDVFAMKFDAITTRKTKKDFLDTYESCQHFSFHEGYQHTINYFHTVKTPR